MASKEEIKQKPNLSILALFSFIGSFIIARTFAILNPTVVLISGEYHVHHFWYGIALLAIGGWLGISYQSEKIDRLAAILFGAGGGLIGDEVGILLTLSAYAYWADTTYTLVIIFLAFASMIILLNKYQQLVRTEFTQFLLSNASLYFGVFLAVISIAFISGTDNVIIIVVSSVLTIAACIIVLAYFVQRIGFSLKKRFNKAAVNLHHCSRYVACFLRG
ncbi:hypothetical protein HXY32_04145 [Candidatus Bathyarchaeota archaeon]|nr:hypothetical protein [Candidatus Bathyarchaeota archaeon]